MERITDTKQQNRPARLMQNDAPNTRHPLGLGGDREAQRVADLGEVVSILARQYAGELDGEEGGDE